MNMPCNEHALVMKRESWLYDTKPSSYNSEMVSGLWLGHCIHVQMYNSFTPFTLQVQGPS